MDHQSYYLILQIITVLMIRNNYNTWAAGNSYKNDISLQLRQPSPTTYTPTHPCLTITLTHPH